MKELNEILADMSETTKKVALVVKKQNNEIHALRMTLGTLISWSAQDLGTDGVKKLLDMMGDYPE